MSVGPSMKALPARPTVRRTRDMTTMRTIRIRVRGGFLEPLDELALPNGSETTATVAVPDVPQARKERGPLRAFDLGLGTRELTREDAYGDDE